MTTYTAQIELNERGNPDGDRVDLVYDRLGVYNVAMTTSPRGWIALTITLPGTDLRQASQTALSVVRDVTEHDPISLTIMTEAEFDNRVGATEVPNLISLGQAADILGVTHQRVHQMFNEGKLSGYRIGERAIAVLRDEVIARAAKDTIKAKTAKK
jgi:hypothetical protein